MSYENLNLGNRIMLVLKHLGIERAHFADSMFDDVKKLLIAHAESVASLTLVGFSPVDVATVCPIASRLLLVHGDQGQMGALLRSMTSKLPEATDQALPNYEDSGDQQTGRRHMSHLGSQGIPASHG